MSLPCRTARSRLAVFFFFLMAAGLPHAQEPSRSELDAKLFRACALGKVEEARLLLQEGANPDHGMDEGDEAPPLTPLVAASMNGHAPVVELLLQRGVRLTGPGNPGLEALNAALSGSNERLARSQAAALKKEGRKPMPRGEGWDDILRMLLEAGVPPDAQNPLGMRPLDLAVMCGNLAAVNLLLDHGADAAAETKAYPPLSSAALFGHGEIVARLLRSGAKASEKEETTGACPLLLAACAGSPSAVAKALSGGEEWAALTLKAAGSTFLIAVDALLAAGASPDAANRKGYTPLMAASTAGSTSIQKVLLDAGAFPDLPDEGGRTALLYAAGAGKAPAVKLLLARGADPGVVALDGETALQCARRSQDRETVRLLEKALSHGRSVRADGP